MFVTLCEGANCTELQSSLTQSATSATAHSGVRDEMRPDSDSGKLHIACLPLYPSLRLAPVLGVVEVLPNVVPSKILHHQKFKDFPSAADFTSNPTGACSCRDISPLASKMFVLKTCTLIPSTSDLLHASCIFGLKSALLMMWQDLTVASEWH